MNVTGLNQNQYELLAKIFWPEEENERSWKKLFRQITSPEELHQLAWNYNWDDGIEIPFWVIRQSFCDRGTALLLYWRASPRWFYQYSSRNEVKSYEVSSY